MFSNVRYVRTVGLVERLSQSAAETHVVLLSCLSLNTGDACFLSSEPAGVLQSALDILGPNETRCQQTVCRLSHINLGLKWSSRFTSPPQVALSR